jgi:dynein heavy chain 1, cytosolic
MHEMSRYIEQRLVQFQEEELDVKLVVFDDFVDNCLRLDRILRQTVGHALLIGTAGVGKTVISRFVSWMNGLSIFQIKAHAKYSEKDFQEDLRSVMRRCGCGGERISFIIDESNILAPSFLEMMNSLLASGSIPGLFVGEELSKLLQSCRESAIVKGGSSAADPELLAAFHDSVRRHLHVIFTMNPATSEFSGRSSSSPALFNRCVINWMGNWSPKSFQQVCNQYVKNVDTSICKAENVDDNDFKANVSLALVSNHQRACESAATSLSRIVHFSPRQFLDAISQFVRFFHEKRDELDARQLHLNSGLKRLVETESAVAGLQGQLREKNDDLLRQNADAETTLADMVSRQQEAEGRRVAVEQLAAEVKAKQAATELRKVSVESRLKEVEPAVADAQTAVRSIKKAQLDELRVMASPPSAVKMSLEAICTLIYGAKSPSWDDIRKFIRRDDFISGILDFDVKELLKDPKRLKSMRPYFDDAAFNFETVNRSSKACGPLVKWMESQVMFAEVLEQVEPLRVELLRLNDDIGLLSRQKEAATSELQQLQATISSYKESYALLIASVQTTKAEIASVTDKLQRSTQLIQNLASERSRWQIQQESFAAEQRSLLGDAVVHACFCVYSGCFDQEQRSGLLMSWMSNVERLGIIVSSSIQPHKDIVTAQMRLQWAQHGLPSDALCLENACILERALRPPLVIDPSDIAGSYIKSSLNSKAAGSSITSTFNDAAFPRQLENCLRFGTALIVSDVVSVDPILLPLLNREFRKTGGRCLVRLGSSEVDCSPSFSLIMTSRSSSPIIGPDISSRITLVNFTVTLYVLESQLRSIILKHQKPEVDAQLQQLDSLKSECRAHLQELEDSLLSTLSECHGSLLDNDTVISALQNLKLQSSCITNRLADAESSYAAAAMTCAAITPLAHVTSCLFFELQKLRQLRSHYVLSLQSFTSNVKGVLLDQPKDLSTEAIQAQVLRVFAAVTSDVLLWVLQDDRIVACVIIARLFSSFTGHPLPDDELAFLLSPKPTDADQDSDLSVICGPSSAAAVRSLSNLPRFANLLQHIRNNPSIWAILKSYSLSPESLTSAIVTTLPTEWMPLSLPHHAQLWLNVLVAYCFSHRLALSFVRQWLHAMFSNSMIDRETPDVLSLIPRDPHIPLLLLSSSGFDMTTRVTAAASASSASSSVPSSQSQSLGLRSFSMGSTDTSGSGSILDKAISAAAVSGGWVMISNVHLGATAVVSLQKKIAGLKLHPSFRLIFTAEISHADAIHQTTYDNSKVAVFEAPRSARDVLLGALACIEPACSPQPIERSRVLLLVAWLHAVVVTRLQYVPDGWSKRYEFNETDLCNAARVACSWIDRSFIAGVIREHLPMDALDWYAIAFLIGETVRKRMFHLRFKSPALRITCGVSLDTYSSRICRFMVAELTTKMTSQF